MLVDIWLSPNAWSSPCFQSSPHKPSAAEQSQVIGELQRVSVSGDWERYAALSSARAGTQKSCHLISKSG
jgi:hypothetical protein